MCVRVRASILAFEHQPGNGISCVRIGGMAKQPARGGEGGAEPGFSDKPRSVNADVALAAVWIGEEFRRSSKLRGDPVTGALDF